MLALSGYYEEALSLCRNAGEIVNLLALFHFDPQQFTSWKASDDLRRWDQFKPSSVRRKLRRLQASVIIEKTRYSSLSKMIHSSPDTLPQAHNPAGIPGISNELQPVGLLICLNETAYATVLTGLYGTLQLSLASDRKKEALLAFRRLTEVIGAVDIEFKFPDDHANS